MKLRLFIVLACAVLGLSACVVTPYGGRGGGVYYYGGDYGHRVWRP